MNFEELNKEKLDDFYAYIQKEYNKEIKEIKDSQKELEEELSKIEINDDLNEEEKQELEAKKSELEQKMEECQKNIDEKSNEKREKVDEIREFGTKLEKLESNLESDKKAYEEDSKTKDELLDEEGNPINQEARFKLAAIYATEKGIKEKEEEISNLKDEFFKKYSNEFVDFNYFDTLEDINKYIDMFSKSFKYPEELEYYNSKLEMVNKLKENSKLYYSTKYDDSIENKDEVLTSIKDNNKKLNEDVENIEKEFNDKKLEKAKAEKEVKKEKKAKPKKENDKKEDQEISKNEEIKNDEEKLVEDIENDSDIEINTVSSDKLTAMYESKVSSFEDELMEINDRKNEIENEFNDKGIDILSDDIDDYDLSRLKEEYNDLLEREQEINDEKSEIGNLNSDIDYVKKLEIEIAELQNKIKKIETRIEDLENKIDTIDDENEKSRLINEKKNLLRDLGDFKDRLKSKEDKKKDKFYEIKSKLKIDEKKIEKNKNQKNKNMNSNTIQNGYVYSNPTPSYDEIVDMNLNKDEKQEENKEEEKQETSIVETNASIIDLYIKADKENDEVFFNKDYDRFVNALKDAVLDNNLTKDQKAGIKNALQRKNSLTSQKLKEVKNATLFNDVVKKIYGDNNIYELNDYTALNENSELEFKNEVYNDIYRFTTDKAGNVFTKINDIKNMDDKTIDLLNGMIEKYQEGINNGTIVKGDELDKKFNELVLEPVKLQVLNSYNDELQKPYIFRKITGIFNAKKLSKLDKFKDNVVKVSNFKDVKENDKLDLKASVNTTEEISKGDIEKASNVIENTEKMPPEDVR